MILDNLLIIIICTLKHINMIADKFEHQIKLKKVRNRRS